MEIKWYGQLLVARASNGDYFCLQKGLILLHGRPYYILYLYYTEPGDD